MGVQLFYCQCLPQRIIAGISPKIKIIPLTSEEFILFLLNITLEGERAAISLKGHLFNEVTVIGVI